MSTGCNVSIVRYMYKHVLDERHRRYRIRRTVATSAFGQSQRSQLTYKSKTGHVRELLGIVLAPADELIH